MAASTAPASPHKLMQRVLFLIDPEPEPEPHENRAWLPAAFARHGWQVEVESHERLYLQHGIVWAGPSALSEFDLVWPVGFGPRASFSDRWQLLATSGATLINAPRTAAEHHGKLSWLDLAPPTHAASDAATLERLFEPTKRWLLKPAAGSFGEGVVEITQPAQIAPQMARRPGYWLLQRYEPVIAAGEHRSLLVGGRIIASYRRTPAGAGLSNLSQGGRPSPAELTSEETATLEAVAERLRQDQVGFASIDTSGRYLVEVNVANPGGLATMEQLYEADFSGPCVQAVQDWLSAGRAAL